MVAHTGATVRADRLRPLNAPRPIQVDADAQGRPVVVYLGGGRMGRGGASVVEVADRWRIDDEWWRKEVSRMYFRVALANGAVVTIFQDLGEGGWFLQTVATPAEQPEPIEVLVPASATATEREAVKPPLRRVEVA